MPPTTSGARPMRLDADDLGLWFPLSDASGRVVAFFRDEGEAQWHSNRAYVERGIVRTLSNSRALFDPADPTTDRRTRQRRAGSVRRSGLDRRKEKDAGTRA